MYFSWLLKVGTKTWILTGLTYGKVKYRLIPKGLYPKLPTTLFLSILELSDEYRLRYLIEKYRIILQAQRPCNS